MLSLHSIQVPAFDSVGCSSISESPSKSYRTDAINPDVNELQRSMSKSVRAGSTAVPPNHPRLHPFFASPAPLISHITVLLPHNYPYNRLVRQFFFKLDTSH